MLGGEFRLHPKQRSRACLKLAGDAAHARAGAERGLDRLHLGGIAFLERRRAPRDAFCPSPSKAGQDALARIFGIPKSGHPCRSDWLVSVALSHVAGAAKRRPATVDR
jgi:hypothetical protein